jgi:hypothetical protein
MAPAAVKVPGTALPNEFRTDHVNEVNSLFTPSKMKSQRAKYAAALSKPNRGLDEIGREMEIQNPAVLRFLSQYDDAATSAVVNILSYALKASRGVQFGVHLDDSIADVEVIAPNVKASSTIPVVIRCATRHVCS